MPREKSSPKITPPRPEERRFRVRYVFYFALALMLVLSFVSYSGSDYNAITGGVDAPPHNWIGNLGAYLSHWSFLCFGLGTYVLLVLLGLAMLRTILPGPPNRKRFLFGAIMVMLGGMILFAFAPEAFASLTDKLGIGRVGASQRAIPGGVLGQTLSCPRVEEFQIQDGLIRRVIGPIGTMVTGWTFLFAGLVMIYLADFHQFIRQYAGNSFAPDPQRDAMAEDEDDDADEPPPRAAAMPVAAAPAKSPAAPPTSPKTPAAPRPGLLAKAMEAMETLKQRQGAFVDADDEEDDVPPPVSAPAPMPAQAPASAPAVSKNTFETPDIPLCTEAPPEAVRSSSVTAKCDNPPGLLRTGDINAHMTERGEKARKSLFGAYTLPPATMLGKGPEAGGEDIESLIRCRETLQRTLDSFNVAGQVVDYISGPRVTRYEIQLAPGVSVKKVENLESNIAMDMSAQSVRILAPIPGKNLVGVEAPNSRAEAVFMRSLMESGEWVDSKAGIPIILGKNVSGKPIILDLAKAPHLLIAGSTGSGKSVCMNTLIMSMVFRFRPDELRLILVDPKIVEFEDYKTLPHLITPVINDSQKVPIALRWAVSEMERRYHILARAGVKKLSDFNARPANDEIVLDKDGLPIPATMPILVVIVDELADLMMTEAKKDVETSIARIAQKGRAAGIHIVIATQRPSREIITGVIRANLPTKIAFMVGKRVDSQVILDQNGAEALLGKGDMLYLPPGSAALERIQGAMVDDNDIKEVVKFVSAQAPQEFNESVTAEVKEEEEAAEADDEEYDDEDYEDIAPLLKKYLRPGDGENVKKALEIIILERKASTSYLQRRLGIGYNKAAELIDLFEERGIIGPQTSGGGKREVLIFDDIVND